MEQSTSSKDEHKPTPKVSGTESKPVLSTVVRSKAVSTAGTKRKSRGSLDIGKNFNKLVI
jgi:hypothetical protein